MRWNLSKLSHALANKPCLCAVVPWHACCGVGVCPAGLQMTPFALAHLSVSWTSLTSLSLSVPAPAPLLAAAAAAGGVGSDDVALALEEGAAHQLFVSLGCLQGLKHLSLSMAGGCRLGPCVHQDGEGLACMHWEGSMSPVTACSAQPAESFFCSVVCQRVEVGTWAQHTAGGTCLACGRWASDDGCHAHKHMHAVWNDQYHSSLPLPCTCATDAGVCARDSGSALQPSYALGTPLASTPEQPRGGDSFSTASSSNSSALAIGAAVAALPWHVLPASLESLSLSGFVGITPDNMRALGTVAQKLRCAHRAGVTAPGVLGQLRL